MSARRDFICRFCLKIPRYSFLLIDETISKMLHVLFLKMDLDVTDNPLMCGDCAVIVKKLVFFKLVYLKSEKMISSFCTGKNIANVDIKDVYAHYSMKIIDGHTDICRFCIKEVERSSFSLSELVKQNTLSLILKMYMCELDLKIVKSPLICLDCRDNMESNFKFLLNCRDTEDKINAYRQHNILTGEKIMLIDVFETFSNRKKEEKNCNWATEIKEEFDIEIDPLLYRNGEINDHEPCTCDTKDNSHCLRCLAMSTDVAPTTDFIKVETLPSEVSSNRELKIDTGEVFSKDEVDSNSKAQLFECDSCEFRTKHKGNLKTHMLIHKDSSEVPIYQCYSCQFKTKYKNSMNSHILLHKDSSEVKIYQCESCEYKTKRKGDLKKHMLIHKKDSSDVQIYQCDSCQFKTKHKKGLRNHSVIHKRSSEVQIHQCDFCQYNTKRRGDLNKHTLIHKDSSEVKMFRCDSCVYKTRRKRNFRNHLKRHGEPSDILVSVPR